MSALAQILTVTRHSKNDVSLKASWTEEAGGPQSVGMQEPDTPHPAVGREPGYHGQQWELSTACRPQRTALPSSCPSTLLVKDPGPWGPPKQ